MSKKNIKNAGWGLVFIALAILILINANGTLPIFGIWSWGFTIVFGAAALNSLLTFEEDGLVFSLTVLAYIWREQLGLTHVSIWVFLGVALLIDYGLGLILHPLKKKSKKHKHHTIIINGKNVSGSSQTVGDDMATTADADVTINTRMGSVTRYIQSTDFRYATINLSMGEAKVYFDKAQIAVDRAVVEVNGTIGDLALYFPKSWHVQNELGSVIGEINTHGTPDPDAATTGPTVLLTGTFKIGDVNIYYI